jgi:hypothetical protein
MKNEIIFCLLIFIDWACWHYLIWGNELYYRHPLELLSGWIGSLMNEQRKREADVSVNKKSKSFEFDIDTNTKRPEKMKPLTNYNNYERIDY